MSNLQDILLENKIKLCSENHANAFANFFNNKVNSIVNQTQIDPGVYNGHRKVTVKNTHSMTINDTLECLKTIKNKNCEGFDRIPQRILADGAEILAAPLGGLFERIYIQRKIPEQWSVAK